jgi:hypothetical protein
MESIVNSKPLGTWLAFVNENLIAEADSFQNLSNKLIELFNEERPSSNLIILKAGDPISPIKHVCSTCEVDREVYNSLILLQNNLKDLKREIDNETNVQKKKPNSFFCC